MLVNVAHGEGSLTSVILWTMIASYHSRNKYLYMYENNHPVDNCDPLKMLTSPLNCPMRLLHQPNHFHTLESRSQGHHQAQQVAVILHRTKYTPRTTIALSIAKPWCLCHTLLLSCCPASMMNSSSMLNAGISP